MSFQADSENRIPHEGQPLLSKSTAWTAATNTSRSTETLSTTLRWTVNTWALVAVFSFAGILFGWAPLELILLEEGQYRYLCPQQQDLVEDNYDMPLCGAQTNALAGIFTLGQFFVNFSSLFGGIALDILPKSILLTGCAIIQLAGILLLAISDTTTSISDRDYFYLAYSLLAIGGSLTMLSAFPATFLLKDYQAGLLALISCLFDGSSIVFSAFKAIHDRFGWTRREILLVYAGWAVVVYTMLILCWVQLERKQWQQVLEDEDAQADEQQRQASKAKAAKDLEDSTISDSTSSTTGPSIHPNYLAHIKWIQSLSIMEQIQTRDFFFTIFFVAVHMLQCNYYIMTVDSFLLSIGDLDAFYAVIFSWALPSGIIFVPFIERTISYLGVVMTLHTTNILGLLFALTLTIPILPLQAVNFFVFTGFRAYLYATVNTLIATTFGVQTMGRIIGSIFTTSAVIGLVQYPMAVASEFRFAGDYLPMNVILVGLAILPVLATLQYGSYVVQSKHLQLQPHDPIESRSTTTPLSPGLLLASPGRDVVRSIRAA